MGRDKETVMRFANTMPSRDIERAELLTYCTDESVKRTDSELAEAEVEFGTMCIYIGGVLYWIVYWYGSEDERTHAEFVAKESFRSILGFGPSEAVVDA